MGNDQFFDADFAGVDSVSSITRKHLHHARRIVILLLLSAEDSKLGQTYPV